MLRTIHHRNRRTPVPLPAYAPIAQAECNFGLAKAAPHRGLLHLLHRLPAHQPVEFARVDQKSLFRLERHRRVFLRLRHFPNHPPNFDAILGRKLIVPLIVTWHAHNRARPILHQNVVRHPDRHPLAAVRIDRKPPQRNPFLLDGAQVIRLLGHLLLVDHRADLPLQIHVARGQHRHQRMLRRKLHAGRAKDRVHPRREHANLLACLLDREIDLGPLAAPDPVALHGANLLRPPGQLVQTIQQLLRILRDSIEPLLQIALLDDVVLMPPAAAVNHLFIGQHRSAQRAPVHLGLLPVRQPALIHPQKEPLIPAVIIRQAGRDFVGPVVAKPKPQHLPLHRRDIAQRPLPRRCVVLERGILRRQPKGIPPHRVQHVVPLHPHVPGQRVANRVVAHMPHVQLPAGIRQHLEHIIFRFIRRPRLSRIECRIRRPAFLPFRLNRSRVVSQFFLVRHKALV